MTQRHYYLLVGFGILDTIKSSNLQLLILLVFLNLNTFFGCTTFLSFPLVRRVSENKTLNHANYSTVPQQ